ncbi:tetraacyldisaccharide 4'-kinase [Leucothrix sargassi]|nr:tetraacyldisaccharide 4'-kinase [Leucothrix sargassi]
MAKQSADGTNNQISWVQRRLEKIWYKGGKGTSALLPLEGLYRGLATLDKTSKLKKQVDHPVPVIVVGNISVGGTGKTPLVIYLAEQLRQAGYRPAIITRGYAGDLQEWPVLVTADSDPAVCGDEPVLMAQRSGVPVVAGPDRNADVTFALTNTDCDVIISDDGLQHYKLKRDIEIAVVDAARGLGNGHCLPAGPLREPASRLESCDYVIFNEVSAKAELSMQLEVQSATNLKTGEQQSLSNWCGKKLHAVTGIGNPERFFDTLRAQGVEAIEHAFPDHHPFSLADIEFADQLLVLMTEKDAVKCKRFASDQHWYVPVTANVTETFIKDLLNRLGEMEFGKNKP